MNRNDWEAYAPLGQVYARSRGRASVNAIRRDRAEVRRRTIARRLPSLRDRAWAGCPEGMIPRVWRGGILGASVRALAEELGVSTATIEKDIQIIEARDLRQLDLAQRLPQLREEARAQGAKGHPTRLPKPVVYALSREFGVKAWTIRQDIRDIDASTPRPRRKTLREYRFQWARSRPRPTTFPRRLSVRVPEAMYQELRAKGNPPSIVRRALEVYLDSGTHHTTDDCALVVAKGCDPDTIDRLLRATQRLGRSLADVLASLLSVRSKEQQEG